MESEQGLLLEVWREVGRHLEIDESAVTITRMLARSVPLEQVWILRLDRALDRFETVAIGEPTSRWNHPFPREPLLVAQRKRWLTWARRGEVLRLPAGTPPRDWSGVLPAEFPTSLLLGPLCLAGEPVGMIAVALAPTRRLQMDAENIVASLLEPVSAALENDRRLHELVSLREAADADRRSLLKRLGKEESSDEIVGSTAGLRSVMERVELVAPSDAPVLVLGDTGTGKEVVARAIHVRSPRREGPFIRVNCGAIPPELIDSQLFGHERGSFTGASESRQGWFERADRGTLFLDEMGELPLPAQVRLLRVLQDGFIERVGGQHPIRVDVRIVAATHRDLAAMVRSGGFREDLWYRVAVFPILLPPLRERLEDIPALVLHFARRAAHRFGLPLVAPTPEDLELLATYNWPGNIRELAAVVDRATILGKGQTLEFAKALGVDRRTPEPSGVPTATDSKLFDESVRTLELSAASTVPRIVTLEAATRRHIELALERTRGQIEGTRGAAALLGINPHTLRSKMRKYRIDWSAFRDRPV